MEKTGMPAMPAASAFSGSPLPPCVCVALPRQAFTPPACSLAMAWLACLPHHPHYMGIFVLFAGPSLLLISMKEKHGILKISSISLLPPLPYYYLKHMA